MDKNMDKIICKIGCQSQQEHIKKTLSSIIKVYSGLSVSKLRQHWSFHSDINALDVCIIDLDDEQHPEYFDQVEHCKAVIVMSKSESLLHDYQYSLTKPVMNNCILNLLRLIEADEALQHRQTTALQGFERPEHHTTVVETLATPFPTTPYTVTPMQTITQTQYRLTAWPDLSQVPQDLLFNTSRVCALLATKPYSFEYILQTFSLKQEELQDIIQTIQDNTYTFLSSLHIMELQVEQGIVPTHKTTATSSFLSKIFGKFKEVL